MAYINNSEIAQLVLLLDETILMLDQTVEKIKVRTDLTNELSSLSESFGKNIDEIQKWKKRREKYFRDLDKMK